MNKSLALTIAGCLGVGATGYLAVKAGEKYAEVKSTDETISVKDKLKIFAPPIIAGVATMGCIVGSNYISTKEIAGLTAALGVSGAKYREFVKELKEKHPDIYKEVKDEINVRHAEEALKKEDRKIPDGNNTKKCYYSPWCDQTFFAEPYDILQAEANLNQELANHSECSLYDYFAAFPAECDIQLKEWMKYIGWFDGDTTYTYNAGYFGWYVNTEYLEKPEYTIIDFNTFPDYSPELEEEEVECIKTAIDTGTDI